MKRRLVKITDGQQEIEQDIRPRVAVIREKLRATGRVSVLRLPSLQEGASLATGDHRWPHARDIPGPEEYTAQDRRPSDDVPRRRTRDFRQSADPYRSCGIKRLPN